MFHTLGSRIVRRARVVLAVALVALIGAAVVGVGVFGHVLSGGFADPRSASSQATELLAEHFGGQPDLVLLVHARSGTVDTPTVAASGEALTRRLAADPRLADVSSYWGTHAAALESTDHTDALVVARVVGDAAVADTNATAVLAAYAHADTAAATVRIGGDAGTGISTQVSKDLAVAESIAIPLTLVLLILAFGSLVSALLPLAVAVTAIFGCFAELDLLTHITSVSVFAINVATALGLGLGIDYSLLMVNRFREELSNGATVPDAVAATTASAGRTVAFSAVTVAAALSAMLVFPVYVLKSFAYAGIGVTLIAAVAALVVLPALLAVLGHRVNAGQVPGLKVTRFAESPFWARLARGVMRRPALTAVPVVAVLAFLAVPLLHISVGTPDAHAIPATAPRPSGVRHPRRGLHHPAEPGRGTPHPGGVPDGAGLLHPHPDRDARGPARPELRRRRHPAGSPDHRSVRDVCGRAVAGHRHSGHPGARRHDRPGRRGHRDPDRHQACDRLEAAAGRGDHRFHQPRAAVPLHR